MNRNLIFCVFIFLTSLSGVAMEWSYRVTPESKLLVVLDSAALSINGSASNEIKIIVHDAEASSALEVTESAGVIKLSQLSPLKKQIKIEVIGGGLPIESHLKEGSLFIQKWNRDIFAHIGKGKILTKENVGTLIAHAIKGEILVNRHSGKVQVDSVQATSSLKDVTGDMDVQSFMGEVLIEKSNGNINASSNSGQLKVIGGQGSLNLETVKGNLVSQNFDGRVEGSAVEGAVMVTAAKESDVVIKTNQGKVSVATPVGSGAYLNLYSAEGDILLPQNLRPNRLGTSKSFKGRLKGDLQRSSILVKTQSGVVTVR